MTWLNSAALIGLVALGIPVLVHLFGRRVAKRQRFPSLRLLLDARATPATRSRPSDVLLLILRCGVVLAAVLALAQPRWSSPERARNASVPIRLVVVDTSASMRRLTSDGGTALDRARVLARQLLDSAREGMVVETAHPGANIAGAASWLAARAGLRELVIASDFQAGTLSDGNLALLPDGIGLSLRRIAVAPDAGAIATDSGDLVTEAQGTLTRASWRAVSADWAPPFTVLTAMADSAAARAMLGAVRELTPRTTAFDGAATITFPGSPPTPAAKATVSNPWQGDLVLALRDNHVFREAARAAQVPPACEAPGAVVARASGGEVLATVAGVGDGVVVHSCANAGSLAGTALLAALASALTPPNDFVEREPVAVPDEVLRTWERPPAALAPRGREETSPDGRWFWLMAIALLVVEELVRRGGTEKASSAGKVDHERAA